jgi:hypothetical protein
MRNPGSRRDASVRALIVSVLVATGLGFGGRESFGQRPSQPNTLLLFADDQRADTIGRGATRRSRPASGTTARSHSSGPSPAAAPSFRVPCRS